LKLNGKLKIVVFDENGNIKQEKNETNLIVNTGLNFMASRMKDATSDVMSHMGLGSNNTAPNATDTDLGTLLGSRVALTSTTVTDNEVEYIATFSAGEATGAVVEAGIFNAVSSGDMLCRTTFDVVNKSASDSIQITWTITLSAS